jgi:hypothetical protein
MKSTLKSRKRKKRLILRIKKGLRSGFESRPRVYAFKAIVVEREMNRAPKLFPEIWCRPNGNWG